MKGRVRGSDLARSGVLLAARATVRYPARLLQYGVREGREAREAGALSLMESGRRPDPLQFAFDLEG